MPLARTLVEAHLYIDLTLAAQEDVVGPPGGDAAAYGARRAGTTLEEEADRWTLRLEDADRRQVIEVGVLYRSEQEARRDGLRFGHGVSELIDAGQWFLAGGTYARRALQADIEFAGGPGDEEAYREVVVNWEFARDATREAAKFLPPGADEIPDTAFWTEMGVVAHEEQPERFTRSRLEDDIDFYQENIDHFAAMYGDR